MGRPLKFDAESKQKFCESLAEYGNLQLACTSAGIAYPTMREHYREDPEFAEAYDQARREFLGGLEKEAVSRATEGVVERDKGVS